MIRQGLSFIIKTSIRTQAFKRLPSNRFVLKQLSLFSQKKTQQQQTVAKQALAPAEPIKKKLSQYEFDELIQMKTQQSLIEAEKKVKSEEKKVEANHSKLKQMAEQKEYLEKHAEQIKQKEMKLVENIEEQEQQLKRVKVRADKQVDDSKKYSITKIAKELLEAADCVNRCKTEALKEYPDSKDPFILNIIETQKKLAEILKAFDIEEFDPTGKEFDPNTQESLLQIPVLPGCTANTVATTMRTGYTIQGRLLRSARVGIFQ